MIELLQANTSIVTWQSNALRPPAPWIATEHKVGGMEYFSGHPPRHATRSLPGPGLAQHPGSGNRESWSTCTARRQLAPQSVTDRSLNQIVNRLNGSLVAKLAARCRAEWMICMPLGHMAEPAA